MQKWEYRTITAEVSWNAHHKLYKAGLSDTELAQLGNDGWELVGVSSLISPHNEAVFALSPGTTAIQYIFKRPKP